MNASTLDLLVNQNDTIFNGSIFLFHAFDLGDEVIFSKIKSISYKKKVYPKYLKTYQAPLVLDSNNIEFCKSLTVHHFGAVSFIYQVPFEGTFQELRNQLNGIEEMYQKQSISDVKDIFDTINYAIIHPNFFHQHTSYLVIHIDPSFAKITSSQLRQEFGTIIASTMRFETQTISDFQVKDILDSATGYYRDDIVIIDTESAFVFDKEPNRLLDLFELANVQQLELRYFDKLLESKLDLVYNQSAQPLSIRSCLPFVGTLYDSICELSKLKVDISVITERLGSSVRFSGESYYAEIHDLLVDRLELDRWRKSVERKLAIIREVRTIYQDKIDSIREDLLSVLVIILILIETLVAIYK